MNHLRREIGWPDEMQARLMMIEEVHRLGSKKAFCNAVGISYRYYYLIMEWIRSPVHPKIMNYFGWDAVYMTAEDLAELKPSNKRGRPLGSRTTEPKTIVGQREYWRQKQAESRLRRRKGSMVHYTKRNDARKRERR
jgi:hypothetical protein